MEKNGYITRISVESDARLKKIVLTDKAVQLHNFIIKDIEIREKKMRAGLSDVELETFFRVIEKLRKKKTAAVAQTRKTPGGRVAAAVFLGASHCETVLLFIAKCT